MLLVVIAMWLGSGACLATRSFGAEGETCYSG